jgi:integrase
MKLPKYIKAYVDQTGKARHYFRRAGFKNVTLPGVPWSSEFMRAYEDALAGQPVEIGAWRVVRGSLHALAISYYSTSLEFLTMKLQSQRMRRRAIERFCRELDVNGRRNGDKQAATLQREHIKSFMAARADKPGSANDLRKALRALMKHAVDIKMRPDDPTQGIRPLVPRSRQGYPTWQETDIAQFRACHPVSSMARLAMELGLATGLAKQDAVAVGPQHVRGGVLTWIRGKTARTTGIEVNIDFNVCPELREAIGATPSGCLAFLARDGVPFTTESLGKWFRLQCDKAGLPHLSFHGLRKAVARRIADAEGSAHEIMSVTGHSSLKEAERYTRAANRKRLARSALEKVRKRTTGV